ncbi:hypothetical protein B0T16DRAFT_413932 [Cercophora newfieldiana]|uniref:Uncharacterized protein n=1 Tax=Cercophora newfieldiana TaxID=92897 RepID=A0AA40CPK9_9PEZI|nr:hypothetical protein B0T16DRAFT_413932 [Cercophora newfieldiana]
MEVQNKDALQSPTSADDRETAIPSLTSYSSTSVPSLRFPRPQGNRHLANWISNSSPDILQPPSMSESTSLADSAFEIINGTDTESQDGHMSESTGSLEVSRPDDIHSLDGSENHYDSDSDTDTDEESDHSSNASSIRYTDEALRNPSSQNPPNAIPCGSPFSETSAVMLSSIALREECDDESPHTDNISAKRVMEEYTEEASAEIAEQLSLPTNPRLMAATVRQTMSRASLSVKNPLRVLYTGRPGAQREVIIKISGAIWASPKNESADENPSLRHNDGVYNIIPISSFGPTPELDLMEASQCQIKVEHCKSAFDYSTGGENSSSPMYTITIRNGNDREKTYGTIITPEGPVTQPQWALPHIAVFYCADDEDHNDKDTRDAAWKFMKAHKIPCLFITESSVLEKPVTTQWADYIEEDVVHLCLESRDPEREVPLQRFPVDLHTFLSIDPQQMNRNLACLTGMSDVEEKSHAAAAEIPTEVSWAVDLKKAWDQRPSQDQIIQTIEKNKWLLAIIVPVLMTLLAPLLSAFIIGWPAGRGISTAQQPHISEVHGLSSAVCTKASTTSPTSIAATTTTVVINVTSTKTVQLSRALPSTSSLASVLPFAGFLSDRPSNTPVEPETKKTVCSVRVHSPNELLVTLPQGSKAGWLAKGAIDIDVYRGDEHLKSKLSSVDEGIIVEINQKDAYGVLNVSVVTTRRPKINETFEVDFGTTLMGEALEAGLHIFQGVSKAVFSRVDEAAHVIEKAQLSGMAKIRDEAASVWEQALGTSKKYEETLSRVKDSFDSNYQRVKEAVSRQIEPTKRLQAEVDLSLLGAQVRAKLWWLKVQGKEEEWAEYQRNAAQLLKAKYTEILEAYRTDKTSRGQQPASKCGKFGKGRCSRVRDNSQEDESKDWRWRKMILG